MNKISAGIVAALVFSAGVAAAGAPPDVMVLENKNGKVTLTHKEHAEKLKAGCKACHADEKGGKIPNFTKDAAHALCKKCHETEKKGPIKCAECHKKA